MGLLDSLFAQPGGTFDNAYNSNGLFGVIGSLANPQQPTATPAPAAGQPAAPQPQPPTLWEALTGTNRPLPPNTGADIGANVGAAAAASAAGMPASPAAAATGAVTGAATPPSDWDRIKNALSKMGGVTLPAPDMSPSPMMPLAMASSAPVNMRGIQALTQTPRLGIWR